MIRSQKERRTKTLARPLLIIAVVALFLSLSVGSGILQARQSGKVIIFVIDQITLEDLNNTHLTNINSLIEKGAVGAMNARVPNKDSLSPGYLTMGAGNKTDGINQKPGSKTLNKPLEGFGANETVDGRKATDIFYERAGERPYADGAANLSINAIITVNEENDFGAVPGALGRVLHGADLQTAAVGNIDTTTGYGRSVIDIVMDNYGLVDYSMLGQGLIKEDDGFPTGRRTDAARLLLDFERAYDKADVIAVDWGDTTRVRQEDDYLTPPRENLYIRMSLSRADTFVGNLLKKIDLGHDLLLIVTPQPSPAAFKENNLMTPAIMAGRGIEKGLLVTPTTRRSGVLVNIDIAPTVLDYFNIDTPPEMTGQPLRSESFDGDRMDHLIRENRSWVEVRNVQPPALRVFAFWCIAVMLLFMVILLVPGFRKYAAMCRPLLLSIPVAPLVILLLPMFLQNTAPIVLLELALGTAVFVSLISWRHKDPVGAVGVISLTVWAALLLDIFAGGILSSNSILGYSIVGGSRFYGIGNEYSGALIGAASLGSFYVIDRFQSAGIENQAVKWLVAAALGATAFVIGYTGLGAEFGNLLAGLAGFSVMSLGYIRGEIRKSDLLWATVGAAVLVIALVVADVSRGLNSGSHVARLVGAIRAEGADPLIKVVERKIMMNIKLVQYAFWNWVNVASAGVLIVAFYGLKNLLKLVFQSHKYYKYALTGGIVGAVAALLFNDSGVVSMALSFMYLVPATLYLMSYEVTS